MKYTEITDGWLYDAWSGHAETVRNLCAQFEKVDILEIGGGRAPLFALDDLPPNVASYTVNDIEASELARVAEGYRTACFDACADVSQFAGSYDIIISKMLAEHVSDGEKFHANMLRLLKPGGVAFHFFPKLYASPFVVNLLLPERLSHRLLVTFFPQRRSEVPKFPAFYSWCRGTTASIRGRILSLGFSDVHVVPFYGHDYYRKLPGLRDLEGWFRKVARKLGLSSFATYAYVFARK